MPGGRPPADSKVRFLAKVKVVESGCHEWQSTIGKFGYGAFYFRGTQWRAHRVAYELFIGPIPDGKKLLHSCDNRRCVNHKHLSVGDTIHNVQDMDAKGRRGTKCPLTERDAEAIRGLIAQGVSQQKIADAFGIHQTAVSRVKLNKITHYLKEP